jgi:hypothetical protein
MKDALKAGNRSKSRPALRPSHPGSSEFKLAILAGVDTLRAWLRKIRAAAEAKAVGFGSGRFRRWRLL